jgi:GNAT superfamily N-acetyltransferase
MIGVPAMNVSIRPATTGDREALRRFLTGLSPRTAYNRFFTGLGTVPERLLGWLLPGDPAQEVRVAVHSGGCGLVGHAMYTVTPDGVAELAVVVADAWQRRGIGPRLVRSLLDHAQARGLCEARFTVLAGNLPANRLAARIWPAAKPVMDHGVYEYHVPLAARVAA